MTDLEATIGKLEPKAGDIVTIRMDAALAPEHAAELLELLTKTLPEGVSALVLDRGATASVTKGAQLEWPPGMDTSREGKKLVEMIEGEVPWAQLAEIAYTGAQRLARGSRVQLMFENDDLDRCDAEVSYETRYYGVEAKLIYRGDEPRWIVVATPRPLAP